MTASRYDLLPPNATQLERDFSRACSSLERIGRPVPTIRTAKRVGIPDSVVPWLIYEYGLGEILPYIGNNQRLALSEGVLWQRIRGTPEAIRIALGWIGVEGLIDESEGGSARWAEYQLGLSAATSGEEIIDNIVGVARISSPVRSRLQRIYAVYDFRRAVYDECSWDEGSIYDDHSGVRPQPDWPQISYGQQHGVLVLGTATVSVVGGHVGVLVERIDQFRYDQDQWDEGWHTLNHPSLLTQQEGEGARLDQWRAWVSAGYWSERTWGDSQPFAQVREGEPGDDEPGFAGYLYWTEDLTNHWWRS